MTTAASGVAETPAEAQSSSASVPTKAAREKCKYAKGDDDDDSYSLANLLRQLVNNRDNTKLHIPDLPDVSNFGNWKIEVREAVAAASGRSDQETVVEWLNETETLSFEELAKCPKVFRNLDRKLSIAITNAGIKAGTKFSSAIKNHKSECNTVGNRLVTGRELYKIVCQKYQTSSGSGIQHHGSE